MSVSVPFLGAINVGSRRVSGDDLAALFVDLEFENVNTYLPSGNVVFDTNEPGDALPSHIERHLEQELGYEVPTFLRSMPDVAEPAARDVFDVRSKDEDTKTYVVFARSTLDADQVETLDALGTPVDRFRTRGRHILWRRDLTAGESMTTGVLESALCCSRTRRTVRPLERIVSNFS